MQAPNISDTKPSIQSKLCPNPLGFNTISDGVDVDDRGIPQPSLETKGGTEVVATGLNGFRVNCASPSAETRQGFHKQIVDHLNGEQLKTMESRQDHARSIPIIPKRSMNFTKHLPDIFLKTMMKETTRTSRCPWRFVSAV